MATQPTNPGNENRPGEPDMTRKEPRSKQQRQDSGQSSKQQGGQRDSQSSRQQGGPHPGSGQQQQLNDTDDRREQLQQGSNPSQDGSRRQDR